MQAAHHREIVCGRDLRETLRAGPYAWPGGYPLHLVLSDGESLCFVCGRTEFRWIARALRDNDSSGWRAIGCDINWEDPRMQCAHCNQRIPSAYAEDEATP